MSQHPLTVFLGNKSYKHAIGEALRGSPIGRGAFLVGLKAAVAKDRDSGKGMLLQCIEQNPSSVMQRLVEAAQLGLSPAPVHQHFHLVPRRMQGGGIACTSVIGFRGFCDLARRSGEIEAIGAELVFKGEDFEIHPVSGEISHRRDPFADHPEDDLVGAYAWAKLKGGQTVRWVMSKKDLDSRRAKAQTDKMWGSWWKEMYRKTVLRGLLNSGLVPLGEQAAGIRTAIEKEEADPPSEEIREAEVTVMDPVLGEIPMEPQTQAREAGSDDDKEGQ